MNKKSSHAVMTVVLRAVRHDEAILNGTIGAIDLLVICIRQEQHWNQSLEYSHDHRIL